MCWQEPYNRGMRMTPTQSLVYLPMTPAMGRSPPRHDARSVPTATTAIAPGEKQLTTEKHLTSIHAAAAKQTTDLMPLLELGRRAGIGRSQIYELARRDALPIATIRFGRKIFVSRAAFDMLLSFDRSHAAKDAA